MISNTDTDGDPDIEDASPLTDKYRVTHSSPERQSLSGSHDSGPRVHLALASTSHRMRLLPMPIIDNRLQVMAR